MKTTALIIFQKNPLLGKVKTRLAKDIGQEAALEIYQQLIQMTFEQAVDCNGEMWVFYSDYIPSDSPGKNIHSRVQSGIDLGQRMKNAFIEVFENGYNAAVIIGTDCPQISTVSLDQAIQKLDDSDLVIGPAMDGGYYLLGMNKLHAELFQSINWSSDQVLNQTISVAEKLELSIHFLPKFYDIDTVDDLTLFVTQNPKYEYLFKYRR
jgi:uncharacterized protein